MKKILFPLLLLFPLVVKAQEPPVDIVKENTYTVSGSETLVATGSITLKPNTWIQPGSVFSASILSNPYVPLNLSNENYVLQRTFQIPTTTPTVLKSTDVVEQLTYYDGLGRPKQHIAIGQSPLEKDIITHIQYDAFGRQTKEYLPYASTQNNGAFVDNTTALNATNNYYINHYGSDINPSDPNPYSEKVFDNSPLNRIYEQTAPGVDWKKGSSNVTGKEYSNGHSIKFEYQTNTTDEVRLYSVNTSFANNTYTPTLVGTTTSYYTPGTLYKTITKDENWEVTDGNNHTTEEFKNNQGQVILKRTYALTGSASPVVEEHDTYYVYDDFGNLTYVIPPKANTTDGVSTTELAELCYQYIYDHRNRLVEKKLPGKGWESIVYDKLDRPVLTQDANLNAQNKWLFTKYDKFGRVAYTGAYINGGSRLSLQSVVDTFSGANLYEDRTGQILMSTIPVFYTAKSFPNTTTVEIHTINYYDTYNSNFFPPGLTAPTSVYGQTVTTNTRGLTIGSHVRVLGTNNFIKTISYYDQKARPVYVYSHNPYLETTDIVESKLDFTGKVLETKTTHKKIGKADIVTVDIFTYDHTGRLLTQKQQINSQVEEVITSNTYDELGQLISKGVGGTATLALQTVNYSYNIRGWLTGINNTSVNSNQLTVNNSDLFGFKLNYNNPSSGTALYNGNISQTQWKTANIDNSLKTYTYSYDALNRIVGAIDNTGNYNLGLVSYDKNGNILTLQRQGHTNSAATSFGVMDNLSYTYDNGNKLLNVVDTGNTTYGFKDEANLATEYTYDVNGNMKTDTNKGITSIAYNHLNLPTKVTFPAIGLYGGTKEINYVYDANGVKVSKEVVNINITGAGPTGGRRTTFYAGNYIYEKYEDEQPIIGDGQTILQFFSHPEGYTKYESGTFSYVYQYKDHLGNVRLSYTDSNNDGVISAQAEIIEESNYYPFGLKHKGYNNVTTSNGNSVAQKWKYSGKEYQDELGLNWYDISARNYDPALGRWFVVDPLADDGKQLDKSPYAYTWNNPILLNDPTGMHPDWMDDDLWIPEVDKKGNISYVAEQGDSAKTLSEQYGISLKKAEAMTGSKGDVKIDKGMSVSGQTVAEHNDGNAVLRLDLTDKNTTDADIAHQTVFAVRNENVKDNLSDNPDGEGNLFDYFNTGNIHTNNSIGRNFGFQMKRRVTTTMAGIEGLDIHVGFAFHSGRFGTFVAGGGTRSLGNGKYRQSFEYHFPPSKNSSRLRGIVFSITTNSGSKKASALRDYLDAR